jgi:hypothetical protein
VDLTGAVDPARIEKHPLGQGGLAGVNVGHNTDITVLIERSLPRHRRLHPHVRSGLLDTTCLSVRKAR